MLQVLCISIDKDLRGNGTGPILMTEIMEAITHAELVPNLELDPKNPPTVFLDSRYGIPGSGADRTKFYEDNGFKTFGRAIYLLAVPKGRS